MNARRNALCAGLALVGALLVALVLRSRGGADPGAGEAVGPFSATPPGTPAALERPAPVGPRQLARVPQTAPAPARPGSTVVVLDGHGRPQAGLEVTVHSAAQPRAPMRTDAAGGLGLRAVSTGHALLQLSENSGFVWAQRGRGTHTMKIAARQGGRYVLEARAEARLGGQVWTREGLPAQRVRVHLVGPGLACETQTDERGRFAIERLLAGEYQVHVGTRWAFAGPERVLLQPLPHANELSLHLARGSAIAGRVVDEQGCGVEGASLSVDCLGPGGDSLSHLGVDRRTDAEGRFRLEGLFGTHAVVHASKSHMVPAREEFALPHAGADLLLWLGREYELSGHLVDTGGDPIASRLVSLRPAVDDGRPWRSPSWAQSSGTGQFRFRRLPRGDYLLTYDSADFGAGYQLPVGVPRSAELELIGAPGAELIVHLLRRSGEPILRASAQISRDGWVVATAKSDALGRAHFRDVVPGPLRLSAFHDRSTFGTLTLDTAGIGAEQPLEVELIGELGGFLELSFDVAEADRLASLELRIDPPGPAIGQRLAVPEHRQHGTLRSKLLPAGSCDVALWTRVLGSSRRGQGPQPTACVVPGTRRSVEVLPGRIVPVELQIHGSTWLSGRLVAGGEPVADAVVLLASTSDSPLPALRAWTDLAGSFHFGNLVPGSFRPSALIPGVARQVAGPELELRAGAGEELQLEAPTGCLVVAVCGAGGEPLAGARVRAVPAAGALALDPPGLFTDETGHARAPGLAPGIWEVRVTAPGHRPWSSAAIELGAELRQLAVELEPTR